MKRKGNLLLSEFRFLQGKTPKCDSFAEIFQFRNVYFFGGRSPCPQGIESQTRSFEKLMLGYNHVKLNTFFITE